MFGEYTEEKPITKSNLIHHLKSMGGKKDLYMFLSGSAGAGKYLTIIAVRKCCKFLSTCTGIEFDETVFRMTAITGTVASSFYGWTLHSECNIPAQKKYYPTLYYETWK